MEIVKTDAPAKEAAERLNELFREYSNVPVLFLSSGGSALNILEHVDTELMGEHVTIGVLDERFDPSPEISNFYQLLDTEFMQKAVLKGISMIDTRILDSVDPQGLADRWEGRLKEFIETGGKIIATVGVGSDGHTAGIMSGTTFDGELVSAYEVDPSVNEYTKRVTTTYDFLKLIDHAVVYIVGKEKRGVLEDLKKREKSFEEMPAQILWEMKEVNIYTDIR